MRLDWLTEGMTRQDRRLARSAQWQRIGDRLIFAAAVAVIVLAFTGALQ